MIPLLLSDTYKQVHSDMYPKGLTKLVSYWVPRKSMWKNQMIFFGLQAFIKEYLIDYFNNEFFNKSIKEVFDEYTHYMDIQLGESNYGVTNLINLHELGYLPLEINAIPEGSIVNMGIPCIEITNTHPDFAWLVQWIECILQVELWKICNHATIGYEYKKLIDHWYLISGDSQIDSSNACSDFGMRGMSCLEEAMKCSAAWLLSFNKTSTIPALHWLDNYYNADCYKNKIGIGAISTEHSVMGANYAIDGDERMFVKKLLTELYANSSFSMVSDTYDYWNMVNNIIPSLKEEILNHNGKLLIRPDSGDQVSTVIETIKSLWNTFNGSINDNGYKVLDKHIGVILGDGCTLQVVESIFEKLHEIGFAPENVIFGVGAFCFSAIIDNKLIVNTRDLHGVAMKATYGVINDKEVFIYKDPKTDTDHLKKSHKGLILVKKDGHGFIAIDGMDQKFYDNNKKYSAFHTVFKDGKMLNVEDFMTIRKRLKTWVK